MMVSKIELSLENGIIVITHPACENVLFLLGEYCADILFVEWSNPGMVLYRFSSFEDQFGGSSFLDNWWFLTGGFLIPCRCLNDIRRKQLTDPQILIEKEKKEIL